MSVPSDRSMSSTGRRAAAATAACVALSALPTVVHAQCEPAPRTRDPLTQAVATLHAPARRPAPVTHARPIVRMVARPIAAPTRAPLAHTAKHVAAPARRPAKPRAKPIVKPAAKPVACRTDSTLGLPRLKAADTEFGAVPVSPFVIGMVASEETPPMRLAELPPRAERDSSDDRGIPFLVIPGSVSGASVGITVATATAGGLGWHFFWRPPRSPMTPPPSGTTPGTTTPSAPPPYTVPDGPGFPTTDTPPGAPGNPSTPTDTVTSGGPPTTPTGGGGSPPPPRVGDPLFPQPIPGQPFPQIPTGGPPGTPGGPGGPPNGGPYMPPGGPQSAVPEPATSALLLTGGAALLAAYRRRKPR